MREARVMRLVFTKYAVFFFFFNWIYQNSARKKKNWIYYQKNKIFNYVRLLYFVW